MAHDAIRQRAAQAQALTRGELIAFGLCVLWMLGVGAFFLTLPAEQMSLGQGGTLRWVLMVVATLMPAGLVWVAVFAARTARIVSAEAFRVQVAIDDLRQMQMAQGAAQAQSRRAESIQPAAAPVVEAVQPPVSPPRREQSRLIVPRAAPQATPEQPALALGVPPEDDAAPLARADLVRALNFPDDENDTEGFAALRRALRDRNARRLVQASQDVLTLLSQDAIYADDLAPSPVPADLWRRFAQGERGQGIARLGAVSDERALSRTSVRMREDTIFRDTVHHFLRRFDEMLVTFEDQATDGDLTELGDTRTARAFMLLARTTGTFD